MRRSATPARYRQIRVAPEQRRSGPRSGAIPHLIAKMSVRVAACRGLAEAIGSVWRPAPSPARWCDKLNPGAAWHQESEDELKMDRYAIPLPPSPAASLALRGDPLL